ncbi:hypothetical protein [Serratia symbiotica]|uniref:hypothetical protein n=1 Tax=Serratia symbiotica TaxID=138074 RepID=UPI0002FE1EFA
MKSVLINAATLPIYHDILSHLLTDAVTHGTSMGYDTQILHEDTESYFHNLKPTLTKGRMLLRNAVSSVPCNWHCVQSPTAPTM